VERRRQRQMCIRDRNKANRWMSKSKATITHLGVFFLSSSTHKDSN
jgi:hypothetical protein